MSATVVIVGAGLSGLVCAYRLQNLISKNTTTRNFKVVLVEARDRLGGRLYSQNGVDLGGAWSWFGNDKALLNLASSLQVPLEKQYAKGTALFHTDDDQVVSAGTGLSPSGDGRTRFKGSTTSIIQQLSQSLDENIFSICLNSQVRKIFESESDGKRINIEILNTEENSEIITADLIVLALPPKLISNNIEFSPPLPNEISSILPKIPTWMENTGKVVFEYSTPFWREKGLSGTVFSQNGPMMQIWDNSIEIDDHDDDKQKASRTKLRFMLAAFVFDEDLHYLRNEEILKNSPIFSQMCKIFGPEAKNPVKIYFKSWIDDPFTHYDANSRITEKLPFGHSAFYKRYMNEK